MVIKKLDCTLEERHSEKSGKNYKAVIIKITDTYEKMVMLDKAEIELIELTSNKTSSPFGSK